MNLGQTVFSQLIEQLPHKEFQKCVARYRGDHYLKSFSCWDQFLAMGFAQLTYRESLRDIEACLRSMQSKLDDIGHLTAETHVIQLALHGAYGSFEIAKNHPVRQLVESHGVQPS